jgi:hypothetical protein
MYIWLRQRVGLTDFDEYISLVVVASTEELAKAYRPRHVQDQSEADQSLRGFGRKKWHTKRIGVADPGVEPGIISSTFRAG